jgi:hypothetical protein
MQNYFFNHFINLNEHFYKHKADTFVFKYKGSFIDTYEAFLDMLESREITLFDVNYRKQYQHIAQTQNNNFPNSGSNNEVSIIGKYDNDIYLAQRMGVWGIEFAFIIVPPASSVYQHVYNTLSDNFTITRKLTKIVSDVVNADTEEMNKALYNIFFTGVYNRFNKHLVADYIKIRKDLIRSKMIAIGALHTIYKITDENTACEVTEYVNPVSYLDHFITTLRTPDAMMPGKPQGEKPLK